MLNGLKTKLNSLKAASKYQGLVNGQTITLPNGKSLYVKLEKADSPKWNYKFKTHKYMTTLTGNGFTSLGCGEDNNKLIALQKSLSESFERIVFSNLKGTKHSSTSTNGWACHPKLSIAKENAMLELLERDASLVHFLKQTPFTEITDIPKSIRSWISKTIMKSNFTKIKILLSNEGFIPTISAVAIDKNYFGLITHSASFDINTAIEKSLTELSRIMNYQNNKAYQKLSSNLHNQTSNTRFSPHHYAFAYRFCKQLPSWLIDGFMDYSKASKKWGG